MGWAALTGGTRRRNRIALFAAAGIAATGLALVGWATDALRRTELDSIDLRFSIRGAQPAPRDIVVVGIDDVTFEQLQKQWPFPRRLHAHAIDLLRRDGARTIVYDVQFTERSRYGPADDDALIRAVTRARNVVLGTTEVDAHGRANVFGGDSVVRGAHTVVGNGNFVVDPGNVIHRVPYEIDGMKSLAVVAAERALGERISPFGSRWIDFAGPPGTVRTISFSRLVLGQIDPSAFRGKVVVIGPVAPSLQDVHPVPTSSGPMPGAEVQANAIESMLEDFPLHGGSSLTDALLIVLLGLTPATLALRLRPLRASLVALVLGAAYAVAAQIAFDHGLIVSLVYPLAALVLAAVGALAAHYLLAALERQRTRDLFARFVPEDVVGEVLAQTDGELRLGGRRVDATLLFSDLRGFTTFAETREAEEVIDILNRYLGEMTEAILDHGGTLVSFMGDGIMAVFGAPIERADHADRALAAAREMLAVRLPRVNAWLEEQGVDEQFRMGIGLNSGPVMSGNVGSEKRLEYTTIGDTTNTASRLEGMTKGTGHSLFLAETTRERFVHPPDDLIEVGEAEVRGRSSTVRLWSIPEPLAEPAEAPEAVPRLAT